MLNQQHTVNIQLIIRGLFNNKEVPYPQMWKTAAGFCILNSDE